MRLNKKSWHARYYRFITGGGDLPSSYISYVGNMILYPTLNAFVILLASLPLFMFGFWGGVVAYAKLAAFIAVILIVITAVDYLRRGNYPTIEWTD